MVKYNTKSQHYQQFKYGGSMLSHTPLPAFGSVCVGTMG
jgi:hypothetical protein